MAMMAANDFIEEAGENRWRPTAVSLALGDRESTAYNALMWWCVYDLHLVVILTVMASTVHSALPLSVTVMDEKLVYKGEKWKRCAFRV